MLLPCWISLFEKEADEDFAAAQFNSLYSTVRDQCNTLGRVYQNYCCYLEAIDSTRRTTLTE